MIDKSKIKFRILTLIGLDKQSPDIELCDYLSFKSSKDINSYIGNEFNFIDFYNNELTGYFEGSNMSSINNIDDKEKYMVYIYPEHKNMMGFLEEGSFIELFEKEKLINRIDLPEGGILNIRNEESSELGVELIAKKIDKKNGK